MASQPIPPIVDTVIIGNGPSALILSYILHGNIPYYNPLFPHPDPVLHKKLSNSPCLLDIDIDDLTAHFAASRLSYSTQALPVNVLLDTLLRPLADTEPGVYENCVEWRLIHDRRVEHLVLGNTAEVGGQWADNPVSASWDIGTLSYSEMLSLPGYTFEEHYQKTQGRSVPDFYRPPRREVAGYLAAYPAAVGILDSIHSNEMVANVRRTSRGFCIGSHNVSCNNIVLASGTFSKLIPSRPLLRPLITLSHFNAKSDAPLLVVGSGFTAADVILSTRPDRKIIHIFKWDPERNPSPLQACHPGAYPEYASIYRHMKKAARAMLGSQNVISRTRNRISIPFLQDRNWGDVYEGLPNTYITAVDMQDGSAVLTLMREDGCRMEREISSMEYVIGRRGSLAYLDDAIAKEMGHSKEDAPLDMAFISGKTLRPELEHNLHIAPKVFVIGSLTGDSLIRFAYGSSVYAAREIERSTKPKRHSTESSPNVSSTSLSTAPSSPCSIKGLSPRDSISSSGHSDLHLNRTVDSLSMDQKLIRCELRREPG